MKKQASLLLAGMLLITSLSACGESPEPNTGEENGEHSSITLRNYMALPTTDPADTNETGVLTVNEQIYEGLYALNEAEGGYDKLLAKEVEISDDGTIYDITLQDGVKFHNGETMTSADVVFSYENFMSNSKYNTYTNMIVDVEAVDDTHVRITLDRPYSPILHTFYKVKILSQKEVESQGDEFGTVANLAGTGPYSWDLDAYKPTTSWTLNAFEDYWQGAPSIKTINYVVIEDDAAAVIALENGEIDWMTVPLANWDDIKNSGKFATDERQSNEIFFLSINWEASDILANDKVREAIAYAMDREAMNQIVCEGLGTVTNLYINPNYAEAAPTECDITYPHDVEKAKELLAEAGYPNGVDIGEIVVAAGRNEAYATVLQANLAEAGITAKLTALEYGAAVDRSAIQDFDLYVAYDSGNYDFNNFRQQAHSESVGIMTISFVGDKFDYKHFEELFAEGERLTNEEDRRAVYTELYNEVMATYCQLPMVVPPVCSAWNPDLNVVSVPTYYRVADWSWS